MTMLRLWICVFYSMIAWIATGDIPFAISEDVLDGIIGETLLVKTWSENSYIKSIIISRGKSIRVSVFFYGSNPFITNYIPAIIILKYNNATRETSLILERLSIQADGLYTVEETTWTNRSNAIDIASVKWDFKLNVIDPKKVQRCNVRGTMDVEFRSWLRLSYLYYYGQMIAYFDGDGCHAVNHSHLYGRLQCRSKFDIRTIIMENVTQRDIGLYNVVNRNNISDYFYLNVTDEPSNGIVGQNVTINWFYSQQGTNRTMQIIHPNHEKMMSLSPENKPKIGLAFQERLIYNGDITIGFMSLTLLNIRISDNGVLRIETLHGLTIPGCKHLVVKDVSSETPPSADSDVTLYPEENTISTSLTVRLTSLKELIQTSVPIYVVLPMAVLILALLGYVVWIQQKRSCKCETDQSHSRKQRETGLYITPVGVNAHLPLQMINDGHALVSNTAEFESSMPFTYNGQPRSMNEYDIVDISSTCSVDSMFSTDKTGCKGTETTEHSSADKFGF